MKTKSAGKAIKETLGRCETPNGVCWVVLEKGKTVAEIVPDPFGPFERTGVVWALSEVRLLAPVVPSKVVGVGVNYSDHAVEFGHEEPKEPLIFLKPPSAVIATEETIRLPARSRWVEYEAEIAVVIGRRARNVSVAQAENYILGYSLMNDVTARDLQKDDGQWMRAKGFDTFAPLGPWIVTGLNPKKLRVQAWLNGRCRQNETTAKMIFDIPTLVSFISRVMTLEPGDVISTGTPSGVAPLKSGDRIEIRSPEIGRLVNKVL